MKYNSFISRIIFTTLVLFAVFCTSSFFPQSVHAAGVVLARSLSVGSSGSDVSALQTFLKAEGYFTANVTGYFGAVTKMAVEKYQISEGISAIGIVGPQTRAALAGVASQNTSSSPTASATFSLTLTKDLGVGSTGSQVTNLQEFLKVLGYYTYPSITGYYGTITATAVKAYQIAHNLTASGIENSATRASMLFQAASLASVTPIGATYPTGISSSTTIKSITTSTSTPPTQTIISGGGGGGGSETPENPPVINDVTPTLITSSSVVITWITNEDANSQVLYGTTTSFTASTTLDSSLVTSHSEPVTGLAPNTTYYYEVVSIDASGNVGDSGVQTFTTLAPQVPTAPTLTVQSASSVGTSTVTLNGTVTSTGNSTTTVEGFNYGLTTGYGSATSTTGIFSTGSFSDTLTGLLPNTTYHVQAFAMNSIGTGTSTDIVFTTNSLPDLTPPIVAMVAPTPGATVSGSAVTLTASSTDNVAVAGVAFYIDGAQFGSQHTSTSTIFSTTWNSTATTSGTHTIFAVSEDTSNNYATSSPVSFTVSNSGPIISSVATSTTQTTATITWSTNTASNSLVNYGATSGYGSASSSASLVTSHSILLAGLSPNTTYHYQISSTDAFGNTSTTSDQTYTTSVPAAPIISAIASSTTQTTATITWTTDQAASSTVLYGLTNAYGSASSTDAYVTSHSIIISGLTANTTYHFDVGGANSSGIISTSSDQTFTTASIPVIPPTVTVQNASSITSTSAVLNGTITASGNASSTVEGFNFGTTTAYGSATSTTGTFGTGSFSDMLSGLLPNTTYHIQAFATNGAGTGTSTDTTFTTSVPSAPVISAIASSTTQTTATITWTTDQAASSTVNYGLTTSYGTASTSAAYVTSHSITLTGLTASTTYHFQVGGANSSGVVSTSTDNTFTTNTSPDVTPPVISNIATSTTQTTATITWNTNEIASSTVAYGLTTSYGSASSSPLYATTTSITITGLTASTTYHFQIQSTDPSNNLATSSDMTLTTPGTQNQAMEFGALTLAGEGGLVPTAVASSTVVSAAITSGNSAGHWQISSSGALSPTSAGQTAQLNQGPYSLGLALNTGTGTTTVNVTITIRPNTYTISTTTDLTTVLGLNESTQLSGNTIELRPGYYDTSNYNFYGHFENLSSPLTITAANIANTPEINHWVIAPSASSTAGNLIFTYIHFYRPQLSFSPQTGGGVALVDINGNTIQNVTFNNDEFSSDMQPARLLGPTGAAQMVIDGGYEIEGIYCGSHTNCINLTVENSKFHNMGDGIQSEGTNLTYINNEFYYLWADAFDLFPRGNNTPTDGVLIKDNYFHDQIGDDSVLHPDFLQVYGQSTPNEGIIDGDINDVTVVGNVVIPGYEGIRQPPKMAESYHIASTTITSNTTLTASDTEYVWFVDATNGNVTVTLPPASAGTTYLGIEKSDTSANTVTILPSGSDTINGASSYTIKEQSQALDLTSNGVNGYTGVIPTPTLDALLAQNYNTPLYYHWVVEGNIFDALTIHGITFEDPVADSIIRNNTLLSPLPGDTNGDGVVDGSDGYTGSTIAGINPWGDTTDMIEDNAIGIFGTSYQLNTATGSPQLFNNVIESHNQTSFQSLYQGPTFNPQSRSDVVSENLMLPNGGLDTHNTGTFQLGDVGALGTTASNGFYDFNGDATSSTFLLPQLTNLVVTGASTTAESFNLDTDTNDGTIYYVVSTNSTVPTAAQIIAGNDATGSAGAASGSIPITLYGLQSATTTPVLTPVTNYYVYLLQSSAEGQSAIVSSSFTSLSPSYNEHLVSFGTTATLSRTGTLTGATSTPTGLYFASFTVPNVISSSATLITATGTNMSINLNEGSTSNSATIKTLWNNNPVNLTGTTTVYGGQRINLLISMNGFGTSTQYIWTSSSTQWVQDATYTPVTAHMANLNFSPSSWFIGSANAGGSNHFKGSMARLTLWQGITLPDISSSTIQNEFSSPTTGITVNPATTTGLYGTPLIDFWGTAATWNAGTNNGSGGNFVMSGTVT